MCVCVSQFRQRDCIQTEAGIVDRGEKWKIWAIGKIRSGNIVIKIDNYIGSQNKLLECVA